MDGKKANNDVGDGIYEGCGTCGLSGNFRHPPNCHQFQQAYPMVRDGGRQSNNAQKAASSLFLTVWKTSNNEDAVAESTRWTNI